MSVARAQAEIDSAEFAEWIALSTLEPIGEDADYYRTAIVAQQIVRCMGGKNTKIGDFIPQFDKPQQSHASVEGAIRTWLRTSRKR